MLIVCLFKSHILFLCCCWGREQTEGKVWDGDVVESVGADYVFHSTDGGGGGRGGGFKYF